MGGWIAPVAGLGVLLGAAVFIVLWRRRRRPEAPVVDYQHRLRQVLAKAPKQNWRVIPSHPLMILVVDHRIEGFAVLRTYAWQYRVHQPGDILPGEVTLVPFRGDWANTFFAQPRVNGRAVAWGDLQPTMTFTQGYLDAQLDVDGVKKLIDELCETYGIGA